MAAVDGKTEVWTVWMLVDGKTRASTEAIGLTGWDVFKHKTQLRVFENNNSIPVPVRFASLQHPFGNRRVRFVKRGADVAEKWRGFDCVSCDTVVTIAAFLPPLEVRSAPGDRPVLTDCMKTRLDAKVCCSHFACGGSYAGALDMGGARNVLSRSADDAAGDGQCPKGPEGRKSGASTGGGKLLDVNFPSIQAAEKLNQITVSQKKGLPEIQSNEKAGFRSPRSFAQSLRTPPLNPRLDVAAFARKFPVKLHPLAALLAIMLKTSDTVECSGSSVTQPLRALRFLEASQGEFRPKVST
ncbi:Protein of unknown function [Gryllus bimaculatus]|nr:Protein of unknown function [Gryllus bimaculatus]